MSGNRVTLEFDRNVQVPNKPSFIYVDAHREGTPTGEQVTLFDFVVTAEEKDDYTDANGVKHFVCKIAQVLADGSVSDLRPEGKVASKIYIDDDQHKQTEMLTVGVKNGVLKNPNPGDIVDGKDRYQIDDKLWYEWDIASGEFVSFVDYHDYGTAQLITTDGVYELVTQNILHLRGKNSWPVSSSTGYAEGWGSKVNTIMDCRSAIQSALNNCVYINVFDGTYYCSYFGFEVPDGVVWSATKKQYINHLTQHNLLFPTSLTV